MCTRVTVLSLFRLFVTNTTNTTKLIEHNIIIGPQVSSNLENL